MNKTSEILAQCKANLDDSNDFGNLSVRGVIFNPKRI